MQYSVLDGHALALGVEEQRHGQRDGLGARHGIV